MCVFLTALKLAESRSLCGRSTTMKNSPTFRPARRKTPILYEITDGKPNLINFEYADGVYVVHKILDRGYLAIGKEKLNFTREQ